MNVEISWLGVLVATVAMFVLGALWYMPLFGKLWGQMHGFDRLSKKEQKEMQQKMGPYYLVQILVTVLSVIVLSHFILALPDVEYYKIAVWVWVGFVLPTQVSAVIFGGTPEKWILKKILIMSGDALVRLLVASYIIHLL